MTSRKGKCAMRADECSSGPAAFQTLSKLIDGKGRVHEYWDAGEQNSVAVASFEETPQAGLVTFSTVTMHQVHNDLDGKDIRVELLGVTEAGSEVMANVLSSAGITMAKDGWLVAPGVVFPDVVTRYLPDTTTPHVMWTEPFVREELSTVEVEGAGSVHWLMGLPLTDAEVELLHDKGRDALEEALEAADVAWFDLGRASTV